MYSVLTVCVIGHHRASIGVRVYLGFGYIFLRFRFQFLFCGIHKPQFNYLSTVPTGKNILVTVFRNKHITG